MCKMSVWIYGLRRKKKGPIIHVALTAQNTPTSTPNMVLHVFTWDFMYGSTCYSDRSYINWHMTKLHCYEEWVHGPFLQNIPHKGASLQNSILLQDLCCTVCKPQLFSMDNNAMVLLHFMLMMHMYPFAIQVKPVFFYGGPNLVTFHPGSPYYVSTMCPVLYSPSKQASELTTSF
jgi:hypothetical protein